MPSDEASFSPHQSRRRPRLQFSLLALFVAVTAVCFLVAWLAQPEQCEAVAMFRVRAVPPTLTRDEAAAFDAREFELLRNSHLESIRSEFVLQTALRNPGVAALTIVSSRKDPAEWLSNNIRAKFLHDSEILSISMRGPATKSNELRQIVDAVATAYQDEVVYEDRQRQLIVRDAKARSVAKLREKLTKKMRKRESTGGDSGGNSTVEAKLLQLEIETVTRAWQDLSLELEFADIESNAPNRIQKVQAAVIRFD